MNRNRGIWIVIGSILVIGILITLATSSFVKSKENAGDSDEFTGFSNSEIQDAPEEAKVYSGAAEPFSANMAAPQEAPVAGERSMLTKNSKAAAKTEPAPENKSQPADAQLRMKSAPASDQEMPVLMEDARSGESSLEETVMSPINPDTKSKVLKSVTSSEGAAYYQKQLLDLDAQIKKMREESGDSNTYSMKALVDKELKLWNREQNTIYAAIFEDLNENDRKDLEASQQEWIKNRDVKAEEAAKKYSGGSLEELEYTASLTESTRSRAYDLVSEYIEILSSKEGQ